MSEKEIDIVENVPYEIKHIEWRIPDNFLVTGGYYSLLISPEFSFADISWQLWLYPREYSTDYIEFVLKANSNLTYTVEYYVGFKRNDDSLKQLVSGTVKKNECWTEYKNLILKAELLKLKSELVSSNTLTITCRLIMISNVIQHSVLDQTKALKLIKLEKLSENFKDLFNDKESSDVTLKVNDKEYKAHRSVLTARSRVFAANFKHDMLENKTGIITILDCDSDSFKEFLQYIYSGKLEELSFHKALNLYYTSDKYDVQELKAFCIDYLKQCLSVENICEIINFANTYDETALLSVAQDFFNKNVNSILDSSEWECFMKMHFRLANKLLKAMPKVKYEE